MEESLKLYLKEISLYSLLSAEDEKKLAKRKRRGGKKSKEAEEKLICCNLRLVIRIANKFMGRGLNLVDLIQAGNLGLIEAVKKFDERKGNRFGTYAAWWIRVYIQKALMKSGTATKIPFYFNAQILKIVKAEKCQNDRKGSVLTRSPTSSIRSSSASRPERTKPRAGRCVPSRRRGSSAPTSSTGCRPGHSR